MIIINSLNIEKGMKLRHKTNFIPRTKVDLVFLVLTGTYSYVKQKYVPQQRIDCFNFSFVNSNQSSKVISNSFICWNSLDSGR